MHRLQTTILGDVIIIQPPPPHAFIYSVRSIELMMGVQYLRIGTNWLANKNRVACRLAWRMTNRESHRQIIATYRLLRVHTSYRTTRRSLVYSLSARPPGTIPRLHLSGLVLMGPYAWSLGDTASVWTGLLHAWKANLYIISKCKA